MYHPLWLRRAAGQPAGEPYRLRWAALAVICLAIFISAVDTTAANVALASIGADLGSSTSGLQWVMDAFNIVLAAFVLLGGGLADRWGRKGTFMAGLALFGAASVTAALSASTGQLVASRAAMGLGAALIYPAALSLLASVFPPDERLRAIAVWASVGGAGLAFGPVLGGLLLDHLWWGSIFLINVPVVAVGLLGAALVVPTSRKEGTVRLDRLGAVLSVLGLGGLVYAIIEGPAQGFDDPVVVTALGSGLVFTALFAWWELSLDDPMFDPRLLRIPRVAGGSTLLFTNYLTLTGVLFVVPLYLEFVLGDSTLVMGLSLLPLGLAFTVASLASARITEWITARWAMVSSFILIAVGCQTIATARHFGDYAVVAAGSAIMGTGLAVGVTPATNAVIDAVGSERSGDASAINQIMRQLGACMGVAVLGSVFAAAYAGEVAAVTTSLTESQAEQVASGIAGATVVAADIGAPTDAIVLDGADAALDFGLHRALTVAAGLSLAGAVVGWRTMAPRPADRPGP